jgi:hypothetical protein
MTGVSVITNTKTSLYKADSIKGLFPWRRCKNWLNFVRIFVIRRMLQHQEIIFWTDATDAGQ